MTKEPGKQASARHSLRTDACPKLQGNWLLAGNGRGQVYYVRCGHLLESTPEAPCIAKHDQEPLSRYFFRSAPGGAFSNVACQVLHRSRVHAATSEKKCCACACCKILCVRLPFFCCAGSFRCFVSGSKARVANSFHTGRVPLSQCIPLAKGKVVHSLVRRQNQKAGLLANSHPSSQEVRRAKNLCSVATATK